MSESTTLPEDIKVFVENLQAKAYQNLGVDPARVVSQIAENCKEMEDSSRWPEQYRHLYKDIDPEYKTTIYQNPIIVGPFITALKLVERQVLRYQEEACAIKRPLVATMPIGFLNGLATKDKSGQHAIIIQEGMRFWPRSLAGLFYEILSHDASQNGFAHLSREHVEVAINKNPEILEKAIRLFITDATEPHIVPDGRSNDNPFSLEPSRLMFENSFTLGFNSFVMAHEYSHCINSHCTAGHSVRAQVGRESTDHPIPMRNDVRMSSTLDQVSKMFPGYEIPFDQLTHYRIDQAVELVADTQALEIVLSYSIQHLSDQTPAFVLGALSFYYYLEMNERVHRTIEQGTGWMKNPIYNEKIECQNILFRKAHPCPKSRVEHALASVPQEILQFIAPIWDSIVYVLESSWFYNVNLIQKIHEAGDPTIDRKWLVEVPDEPLLLGSCDTMLFRRNDDHPLAQYRY